MLAWHHWHTTYPVTYLLVLPQPKNTPCLPFQCMICQHIQEEVWHIHLHSGQQHRHHTARRPGCALPVMRPKSPTGSAWLLGSHLPPPSAGGSSAKGRGITFIIRDSLKAACLNCFVLSCSAPLLWSRSANWNLQPSTQQKEQILWLHVFRFSFQTFLNTLTVCLAKHFLWVTLTFILKT